MKNIPPSEQESQIQAARWNAIGRGISWLAFIVAVFLALVIYRAWIFLGAIAPVLLLLFVALLVLGATGTLYNLHRYQADKHAAAIERFRHNTYVHDPADFNGNYPVFYDPLTGTLIQANPGNMQQPVPQTLTYSPHYAPQISYSYENEIQGVLPAPGEQIEPIRDAPSLEAFYDAIKPNTLQTGMGAVLSTGALVLTGIPESVHYKLIGGSGFGKSCMAGALLDIATTCNNPDHLRIALLDLEWRTARLFEHLPHVYEMRNGPRVVRMIGRDADEVAARLGNLKQELNRRAAGSIETPILLVYVEEMLSLRYEVDEKLQKQMLDDLNILALRGRKYGIFFLACMQVDYSSKELREAKGMFRTRGGFAIDPPAARASGFINSSLVKENFQRGKPGQYVLEKPAFSELVLAPRYNIEQKLLASEVTSKPTSNSTTNDPFFADADVGLDVGTTTLVEPLDVTNGKLSIRELKVLELLRQELGQNEIIKEVWSVSSKDGRPYRDAVEEYRKIVATLVARGGDL